MIEGAELIIHLKNGENLNLDLTPTQLAGVIKLLGISYDLNNDSWTMFSDNSLNLFMNKTINRFKEVK